jgi:hypothetical protein
MNKSYIAAVTLLAFLNATFAWPATDRYLVNPVVGAGRKITDVCVERGVGYSAHVSCLAFDSNGGIYDIGAGVIRGIDNDGEMLKLPIEEIAAIKVLSLLKGKATRETLKLDALREGADWKPPGRVTRAVMTSGEIVEFRDVATELDLENRLLSWSSIESGVVAIPFEKLHCLEFAGDRSSDQSGRIDRAEIVTGEVLEFDYVLPALELDAQMLSWSHSGERTGLPFADLVSLRITSRGISKMVFSDWDQAVMDFEPQEKIRTKLWDRHEFVGRFVTKTDSSLVLLDNQTNINLAATDVDRIWVECRSAKQGAIVGGVIGLIGGAAAGAAAQNISGMVARSPTSSEYVEGAIVGGVVFGVLFCLLGYAIGSSIPRWQLRYEASAPESVAAYSTNAAGEYDRDWR